MGRIIVILVCLSSFITVGATNCADRYFIEKDIALYVCHNYGRGAEADAIYYRGATKALSDYIQLRKDRGELKNKQFHIQMYSSILTQPHYHLSQSNQGYYIMTGRHLNLVELMKLIDKFSEPDFISLDIDISEVYNEIEGETEEEKEKRRDKIWSMFELNEKKLFEKTILQEDMDYILDKEHITWQQGKMKFVYSKDRVKCLLQDKKIEHQPIGYPCVIQNRYILQECGFFKVYDEDATLLKVMQNQGDTSHCEYPFEPIVYNKWVNFRYDSYGEIKYSYSYDKNRFYLLESEND